LNYCILLLKESSYGAIFRSYLIFLQPKRCKNMKKTQLTDTIKRLRKQYGLTQEQLALKSGVGLNFVRELEQGKPTVRLDKVNQVLNLFNYEMTPTEKRNEP